MVTIDFINFLKVGLLATAFLAVLGLFASLWIARGLPGKALFGHFPFVPLSLKAAA